jgi:hypothetical protein
MKIDIYKTIQGIEATLTTLFTKLFRGENKHIYNIYKLFKGEN